ncbi:MAG: hypothetical protein PVI55_21390 [Desulfobacterales bacterium]
MKDFIDHLLEGVDLEGKLTDEEMGRVIRFILAFEDEASRLYAHIMTSTDNHRIRAVFKEIADEKRFQVTHLISLLRELDAPENPLH